MTIIASNLPGLTCRIVLTNDAGLYWNRTTVAYEAINAAHESDYSWPMTEGTTQDDRGYVVYSHPGTFAGVPDGSVTVTCLDGSGGLVSDLALNFAQESGTMTAGTWSASDDSGTGYVTLAQVKSYANITVTTYDAKLNDLIIRASAAADTYCQRTLASASYTEYLDGSGRPYPRTTLRLRNYPVTAIDRVALPAEALQVGNTLTTNSRATVRVTDTSLVLSRVNAGTTTTNTLTLASYATITALVAAINALSAGGWTATADTDYAGLPATDLKPLQGPFNALGYTATLAAYARDVNCSVLDAENGTVSGDFPDGFQNVRVDYTAGYATLPEDVQQAVILIVKNLYDGAGLNLNFKKRKTGDYAYEMTGMEAPEFIDARALLDPYRRLGAF